MIRVVTQILRLFQGVFTRMGVDFDRMLAIVTVKLTVDNRIDRSGRNKKNASNALMRQGILLGICGPIFFLTGIASGAFGVSLLLYQSYLFLMFLMSFMMEYSRILFDGNDNHILQRLPVNSKTILVARLVSMLVYMFFSFRLYVGDPSGDCLFLERGDVRGFFHYFSVSEHDFHVAFC